MESPFARTFPTAIICGFTPKSWTTSTLLRNPQKDRIPTRVLRPPPTISCGLRRQLWGPRRGSKTERRSITWRSRALLSLRRLSVDASSRMFSKARRRHGQPLKAQRCDTQTRRAEEDSKARSFLADLCRMLAGLAYTRVAPAAGLDLCFLETLARNDIRPSTKDWRVVGLNESYRPCSNVRQLQAVAVGERFKHHHR